VRRRALDDFGDVTPAARRAIARTAMCEGSEQPSGTFAAAVLIGSMDHRTPIAGSFTALLRRLVAGAGIATCLAAVLAIGTAAAEDYPARAVKIIVPFPAGGTADLMPRVVADWLSRKWKQAVVIENKAGAAGNIGAEAAFNAEPDGYTLLSSPAPPLVINQSLYPKLGFNPMAFVPVSVMGIVPNALVVNPSKVTVKSVADLIADARAHPGKLTSATQGNGTTRKCSR
jgi:tripartite-type tricarboxylate transporter receptor subunit TctC